MTNRDIIDFSGDYILEKSSEEFDLPMLRKYFYDQHNLVFLDEDFDKLIEINRHHLNAAQKNRLRLGDFGQFLFRSYYLEHAVGSCARCLRPVGKWWHHRNIICEYVANEDGTAGTGTVLRDDYGCICMWCGVDFINIIRGWYRQDFTFSVILREYLWHFERSRILYEWRQRIKLVPMKEDVSQWALEPSLQEVIKNMSNDLSSDIKKLSNQ